MKFFYQSRHIRLKAMRKTNRGNTKYYIRNDEELNKLLSNVTIASGGVIPNIQAVLQKKKGK